MLRLSFAAKITPPEIWEQMIRGYELETWNEADYMRRM